MRTRIKPVAKKNLNTLISVTLALLLIAPCMHVIPVEASSLETDTDVDILFFGDEETMSALIRPLYGAPRPLTEIIEQEIFPGMQAAFDNQLGIDIVFHGWASWDSDDGTNEAWDMLQEAIEDTGGYWVSNPPPPWPPHWKFNRGMLWNGAVIDLAVFWTYQDMVNPSYGFGPYEWGAAIVRYDGTDGSRRTAMHEISHLYNASHCSHFWCVLHTFWCRWTDTWQSTCRDYMINHKDHFTRYVLTIENTTGGATQPASGSYLYYNGTSVAVYADEPAHYVFDYWVLDGETVYGNPYTVTMASDHTLKAHFHYVDNPPNPPDLYGPYLYIDGDPILQSVTYILTNYAFGAYTTDPEGDEIQYEFDWDDGPTQTTPWYSGGAHPMVWHSWSSPGIYNVRVRARDANHPWGDWSSPCALNIQPIPTYSLTVFAYDQYGPLDGLTFHMDGQSLATGHNYTVTEGTHSIYMDDFLLEYPYVWELQYYYYDGNYDYDNPTTLSITADKTVTAYYYQYYRPYW